MPERSSSGRGRGGGDGRLGRVSCAFDGDPLLLLAVGGGFLCLRVRGDAFGVALGACIPTALVRGGLACRGAGAG